MFTTHTPVPAGHELSLSTWWKPTWPALGHPRPVPQRVPGAGPLRQRQRTAVQHDRARAAHGGGVNGVSQLHGHVTRSMWGPIWPGMPKTDSRRCAHQRRACGDVGGPPTCRRCSSAISARDWTERHDDPALWDPRDGDPGRGAVGRPKCRCATTRLRSSAIEPGGCGSKTN